MADAITATWPTLESASREADAIRQSLHSAFGKVEPATEHGARTLPESLMKRALEDALWAWRDEVGGIEQRLDTLSDDLAGTCGALRAADHSGAETIHCTIDR